MLPAGSASSPDQVPAGAGPGGLLAVLFPHLAGLRVDRVEDAGQEVVIWACPGSAGASCPRCGTWSSRVHSRYTRRVADGAAGGRPVVACLTVRRLFCGNQFRDWLAFLGDNDRFLGFPHLVHDSQAPCFKFAGSHFSHDLILVIMVIL